MPKEIINRIKHEYIMKGKSPEEAERIAYAIVNKLGLLRKEQLRKKRGRRG